MRARRIVKVDKGAVGMNNSLKEVFSRIDLSEGSKVVFAGTPLFCLPFAEIVVCAIRGLKLEHYFCPNAEVEKARRLVLVEGYGVQLGEPGDPRGAKVAVLLGGMAIPKYAVPTEKILSFLKEVLAEDGKIVGFSMMGIFDTAKWTEKIPFDYIVDITLDPVKVEEFKEAEER